MVFVDIAINTAWWLSRGLKIAWGWQSAYNVDLYVLTVEYLSHTLKPEIDSIVILLTRTSFLQSPPLALYIRQRWARAYMLRLECGLSHALLVAAAKMFHLTVFISTIWFPVNVMRCQGIHFSPRHERSQWRATSSYTHY